ncbi:hypothetical protein LO771_19495 [Streptacidiphilus sp. ASG 303]|uniref:hypothetical protein n=1 Tax=Streptacidiphilus sp. ASG 303 TaxID=2896847 RepID=UPI001E2C8D7E|nr:hypothetical protein [Streptacidiphilus sp. ASG 303]MCD0484521.1 hypothetical protein [Streptacidiphilus sp. ASG 303]
MSAAGPAAAPAGPAAPAAGAAALEPVRAALLAAARAEAAAALAAAEEDAAALLRAARAEAAALLAEARRQGGADGRAERAAALGRARRAARTAELAARRAAWEELHRLTAARVRALPAAADPAVRAGLARYARRLLGPGAEVGEAPSGGVVARAPGRRVDLGLDALAARVLAGLGAGAEQLWEP